jgi:chemotaxis protein methyltransferase CheR
MKKELDNIIRIMQQMHGSSFVAFDSSFLIKSLEKRLIATGNETAEEYADHLTENKDEANLFLQSIFITYSEFFRNPLTFAVLERIILPSIVMKNKNTNRKEIRIWSAACAAGQEAYSLAMLLEELKNGNKEFTYRIFATDQCESQLNHALKGQYSADALNNLNLKRVKQWFRKQGENYTIKPELKENIDFSVFDLFNAQLSCPPASIFGDFDLLVCANLLFYYKGEYRKLILEKAEHSLANGGYIVAGEVERNILMKHNYREVFPQSAIFRVG